ncbi:probable G-protein coupled receptor 179 isoform X2 [Catharus ustulatus]|uniref:probable G-protein coupled receptor 179 isoform X2 n=1 Tax=Catharus ustulatus TaxID=91951 RepID=UPI001C5B0B60|nr:probable G-protein coupled receptor 179 isoform X2 [Catharus ustulatus]
MLFQTNDIREASVAEDVEWYQALVRSLAEGHPWVRRAVLALDAHPLAPKPRLMLQATKGDGQILLQDVSNAAPSLGNLSWDNEWFNALKAQRVPALRKRVLSNDLRSLETPKWQRGDSYVGDPGHVRWSPPFLECREGQFLPTWVVTLSSAFYGLKPDLSPEFKGVVRVDVELRDVAIDQCSSGPGWFSDTHRCDLNSTQCVPQESRGFVLGRYLCRCKPGFYGAGGAASSAWAGAAGTDGGSRLRCRPCRPGCATCEDDTPCLIQEDQALRAAVLACQACCMLAIFLSMLVSYHFRRSKRIRTSGIILLETILFGSLLLYFPVFILYFKPSIFRCIVLRWVRMLGFAIVYGTITLKLYRVLKVFLSRSAQRAPYVSSGRVLRMLAPILLLVLWFLAAWTIGMLENSHKNIPLVIRAQTNRGLHFSICGHDCWDYMMVIAEMLFLLWGSFLCYATRAVPSAFHEPRYMGIALHNELMVSAAFHVVRFLIVPSLHPDWTLLLFFAHTHGTITMTLALLFIPKFLHTGSPLREEITAEVYEDELDMRRSGSCMNSSIASAWSEHSLDPDDIREELKKLYRQLEVHKTWRMASNNPHLGKKRSSRRSFGRSILRRSGAELAESASRRSSSAKRLVDSGGNSVRMRDESSRRSSSAKRLVDTAGSSVRMRDGSSRRRSSALRKSRSSEGPPRDAQRTPSPPEGARQAGMDLEQSDSDSLDAAPLLCKSASAQNLAGHWRRAPGRAPPLQKSHSVVAGAREVALLAARREQWHGSRHLSAPAPRVPRDTATPQSPGDKGAQEDVAPLGDAKGHKHVTYGPVKSVSVDSAHPPKRVRVTVKKIPPPPPVRYQSLQRSGTLGEGSEPPPGTPARMGEAEGTAGDKAEGTAGDKAEGTAGDEAESASPPAGKGRMVTPSASSAHVCPWELVQEEILSRKQKAAEAAEGGSAGDTAATSPGPKSPPKKSFRSLGLAIKALNRSRGKGILKGKSEGSLRKRGSSRRDKSGLAETSAVSLGGLSPAPAAKSPERSGQSLPLQHNNNAAIPGEAADWGDSGAGGQWDSLALGTALGDKVTEEPSAARGDAGAAEAPEPPSEGHQGAAGPAEVAEPQEGDEDVAGVTAEEGTLEQLEGTSRSFQEEERPPAKPTPSSVRGEVGPHGIAAARGALLRQEAIAAREDGGIPESPDKALEKGRSQPEPERGPGRSWSGAGSEISAAGTRGDSSSKAGIYPGKGGSEGDSQRSAGMEKPPEVPRVAPQQAEGRRAEVCPWESREQGRSVRAEICPWDTEQDGQGAPKSERGEQPGMGLAGKPPALPKPSSQRAGTTESRKNICPWEVEGEPQPKIEICPWEGAAAPSGKERVRQDTWGTSKGEEKVGSRAPEKGKEPPAKSLPKSPAGKAQSSERAEICPWEAQDSKSSDKAEICPWEAQDSKPSDKAEICPWEAQDSKSSDKAEICPWEAQDSKSSDKAEICPWEAQKSKSSDKAEICPWEVAEPQLEKGTAPGKERMPGKEEIKALEKGSRERESICPWESPDMEQPLDKPKTESSELPKSPSGKSQSSESLRAEICPWEGAEAPSQQPKAKQVPAGGSKGDKRITRQAALASPDRSLDSRDRESIGAGDSPDTEQPLGRAHTGSSELPKSPSGKSQSSESLRAEICPWESQDIESIDRAEIGTWEVAELQMEKGTAAGKGKQPGKEETKALEKRSRERESICSWESPDTEQPLEKTRTGSSELPKSPSEKSQSSESLRAEICPWESQDLESIDRAEIGTWETQDLKPKDKAETVPWESQDSKSSDRAEMCIWDVVAHQLEKSATPDLKRPPHKQGSKALQRGSRERESISPWDSPDPEKRPGRAHTGSSELPKSPSAKSQSMESLRAEICPWEGAEAPSQQPKAQQVPAGGSKGDKRITRQAALASPDRSLDSRDRESSGAGDSPDTEQPLGRAHTGSSELPKSPSGKSQSSESLRAEICPWESQDLESIDRAEIGTWEVAELQMDKGTGAGNGKQPGKEETKAVGKGSRERESICSWESPDMEQPLDKSQTGSSELPKSPSGKSQSSESLRAEICPWESQDLESIDRAEICPWESQDLESIDRAEIGTWEVAELQLEKGTAAGKGKQPGKEETKAVGKGSRERESICSWDSPDTEQPLGKSQIGSSELPKSPSGKSQSSESLRAEICPWESQDLESIDRAEIGTWETQDLKPKDKAEIVSRESQDSNSSGRAEMCIWDVVAHQLEKSATPDLKRPPHKGSKALQRGSRERESISPWDSPDPEKRPGRAHTGSSELPKSPSAKSQSMESLRAEICPWESQDLESIDRAEICPWEGAAPQMETGTATPKERLPGKEASRALEKTSRERESICPWETPDTEQPLDKTKTGSSELPKSPSGKSQSSEKAEICPWEVESSDKSEICPWEGAEPQLVKGKEKLPAREASKTLEKRSRDQESIHPWESLATEEPSLKTTEGKEPSKKSDSTDSRKSEICPWEAAEPLGSEGEISQPGVQPQGAHRASPAVSPTFVEKSRGRSHGETGHKPLCRLQPSIQHPGLGSSSSPSTGLAELCPWEAPSAPAKASLDSRRSSEVCPGQEESTEPSRTGPGHGRAGGSPREGGGV